MKLERKVLGGVAGFLVLLSVIVSGLLLGVPDLHIQVQRKQLEYTTQIKKGESVLELMRQETLLLQENSREPKMLGQLRIELPKGVSWKEDMVEARYIDCQYRICIPGMGQSYVYDYPMIGSSNHIEDITYDVEQGDGIITISLDSVYELEIKQKDAYVYLDFVDPREKYDRIVVVDAGHGGKDSGAQIQGTQEKDIDLAILQEMKTMFDKQDEIGVYYTRTEDETVSLQQRVALANVLEADLFLSIHNNSTASGRMSDINGTEVLYRSGDATGASKAFAQRCLDNLLMGLESLSKGVVAGDDIYIIRTAEMPVALAEIGFMTNQQELQKLQTEEYRQKTAQALYQAIVQTLEEMEHE